MEQIDILLATYNGEKYLKQQIDSILSQTYSNFRLIISDDCSTDGTRKILKEYKEKDKRITVYFQEKNLGYVKNFEFLLGKVENEIYALSDQDDVWLPEKIEKSIEKMQIEDSDLVFGDLEIVDENLKTINKSFNDYMHLTRKIKKCNDYNKLYLYNCVTGCTILAKKKFLDKILPIPHNTKHVLHDYWIALITSIYGKISYIEEIYIKYRQHGNNQVGVEKTSYKLGDYEQIRNLFIEVKLELFETNVNNNERFPKQIQVLNNKALEYFKQIRNKENFNFKGWSIFYKLYKNETFSYFSLNFIIMNLPFVGRNLFRLKKLKKERK